MRARQVRIHCHRTRQRVHGIGNAMLDDEERSEVAPGCRRVRRRGDDAPEERFGFDTRPLRVYVCASASVDCRSEGSSPTNASRTVAERRNVPRVAQHRAERSQQRRIGMAVSRRVVEHGYRLGNAAARAQHESQAVIRRHKIAALLDDGAKLFDRALPHPPFATAPPHRRGPG